MISALFVVIGSPIISYYSTKYLDRRIDRIRIRYVEILDKIISIDEIDHLNENDISIVSHKIKRPMFFQVSMIDPQNLNRNIQSFSNTEILIGTKIILDTDAKQIPNQFIGVNGLLIVTGKTLMDNYPYRHPLGLFKPDESYSLKWNIVDTIFYSGMKQNDRFIVTRYGVDPKEIIRDMIKSEVDGLYKVKNLLYTIGGLSTVFGISVLLFSSYR